jgi:hypothetical protein
MYPVQNVNNVRYPHVGRLVLHPRRPEDRQTQLLALHAALSTGGDIGARKVRQPLSAKDVSRLFPHADFR